MQLCFLAFCSLFALGVGADGGEAPETLWTSLIPFYDSMSKMPLVRASMNCSRAAGH